MRVFIETLVNKNLSQKLGRKPLSGLGDRAFYPHNEDIIMQSQ